MIIKKVAFADEKLKEDFEKLANGKFEEKQLYKFINRAINDLKENPFCGKRIGKRLAPERYIHKYNINEIWKYDLPEGWRLIYSVIGDQIEIVSLILEWFNHKDYERRFNYLFI